MQLRFLGEDFKSENCNGMCDNCKTGFKVSSKDCSSMAVHILEFVANVRQANSNSTLKMATDILRGKKSQCYIRKDVIDKFSGRFKTTKEDELRRLIIKLLLLGGLQEVFVK